MPDIASENWLGAYDSIYLVSLFLISLLGQVRHHRQIPLYLVCHSHVPRQARCGKWAAWARVRNFSCRSSSIKSLCKSKLILHQIWESSQFRVVPPLYEFLPRSSHQNSWLIANEKLLVCLLSAWNHQVSFPDDSIIDEFSLLGRSVNQVNLRFAR